MLIRVRTPVEAHYVGGDVAPFPEGWSRSGRRLDDLALAEYLDDELVDIGVVGGELWVRYEAGAWFIDIDYWSPVQLSRIHLDALLQDARGQLSDGAGESMTLAEPGHAELTLIADDRSAVLTTLDDGRVVPQPSDLALHAKKGNLAGVLQALAGPQPAELERRHGGLTPLRWSCLEGHAAAAVALLEAGASVSSGATADPMSTPLATCVLSRGCNDDAARRIAEALVSRGASGDLVLLAEQADAREKPGLALFLRELQQR